MPVIETHVCVDDTHIYPAHVDPTNRWNGWVSPGFTLDTVRQLAAHTDELCAEDRYCSDQIHVIDGPVPVVFHIRWQWADEDPTSAITVVAPDEDGRYWIGGWEWTWYIVDDAPLFLAHQRMHDAWRALLTATGHRIGEVLRAQMPDATDALVDFQGRGHLTSVSSASGNDWPGDDCSRWFDTETLGEADALVQATRVHYHESHVIEGFGWSRAFNVDRSKHHIWFAPLADPARGDGPLEEARRLFSEAHRRYLNDLVPSLAAKSRALDRRIVGVVIHRTDQQLVCCLTEKGLVQRLGLDVPWPQEAEDIRRYVAVLLSHRPSHDDLIACGWQPVPPHMDDTYALNFPRV